MMTVTFLIKHQLCLTQIYLTTLRLKVNLGKKRSGENLKNETKQKKQYPKQVRNQPPPHFLSKNNQIKIQPTH